MAFRSYAPWAVALLSASLVNGQTSDSASSSILASSFAADTTSIEASSATIAPPAPFSTDVDIPSSSSIAESTSSPSASSIFSSDIPSSSDSLALSSSTLDDPSSTFVSSVFASVTPSSTSFSTESSLPSTDIGIASSSSIAESSSSTLESITFSSATLSSTSDSLAFSSSAVESSSSSTPSSTSSSTDSVLPSTSSALRISSSPFLSSVSPSATPSWTFSSSLNSSSNSSIAAPTATSYPLYSFSTAVSSSKSFSTVFLSSSSSVAAVLSSSASPSPLVATSSNISVRVPTTSKAVRTSSATTVPSSIVTSTRAVTSSAADITSTTSTADETSTEVAAPAPSVTLECSGSNGITYTAPSGRQFIIECGIDHYAGNLDMVYVDSFEDCVIACDNTTGCIDVSLSGAACYMKSTLGASITAANIWGAKLKGAQAPISCANNASNGLNYTSPNGYVFEVECSIDHYGGDMYQYAISMLQYDGNLWLERCMDTCANATGCVDVSLSGSACYLKSSVGAPLSNGNVQGGRLVSPLPSAVTTTTTTSSSAAATATAPVCTPSAPTCPACNGTSVPSQKHPSLRYLIQCGIDYAGGDIDSFDGLTGANAFQTCIEYCARDIDCVDVSFQGTACYLKNETNAAMYSSTVWGATLLSS